MSEIHQTRCINHASREAVARCPECRSFFCRECITEHEGRVICASCLQKTASETKTLKPKKAGLKAPVGLFKAVASLLVLWVLFYVVGRFLLLFPDSFHTGELWKDL